MWNPVVIFAALVCVSSCPSQISAGKPYWNNLRVHFGINPFASANFKAMPRTTAAAEKAGFRRSSSCDPQNGFLGHRYLHESGDRSVMLLFDVQGTIAGMQTSIPKSTGVPNEKMKQYHNVYLDEGDTSTITAYFVDPRHICDGGRPAQALATGGTGDGLRFQIGTPNVNTSDVTTMAIPKEESGIKSTKWTKGKCFFFMGNHYWYNLRMDMSCDDAFPAFLLYHRGKLHGFGFAVLANYEGTHYEHPTVSDARHFFPFIPKCFERRGRQATFSTVHVYLRDYPWTVQCLF